MSIKEKERPMTKDEKTRLQMKKWTSFYRLNMHRFVEHYFGLNLHMFQKILIFFMNLNIYFMLIASRGLIGSPFTQQCVSNNSVNPIVQGCDII